MIATIIKHQASGKEDDDDDDADAAITALDQSRDGYISESEIRQKVKFVALRADMLYERVVLEQELLAAMVKLALFLVYTILFIYALGIIAPAEKTAEVHSFLHQHFMLDKVSGIKDIGSIYKYLEDFEHQNEKVQATSANYWCEGRYFSLKWNYHSETPTRQCASPRLYTLYGASKGVPWGSDGEVDSHGSSSGHRRMSSDLDPCEDDGQDHRGQDHRKLAGAGASHVPCEDNDAELTHLLHTQGNVTCADMSKAGICNEDVGLILCRKTCGYCAPFHYERMHAFPYPVVSMLPSMVYQTRFSTKPCHGYAESYMHQKSNPALIILPTLDGTRDSDLITCVDRSSEYSEEWAHKMECPMCEDGWHRDTKVHKFHGESVYPKFLVEAHKDIEIMNGIGWIDIQTKEVVLSTSLYTQGPELFTFLTVTFTFDEAGGVSGQYKLQSIKDLLGADKTQFVMYMFLSMAAVGLALMQSAATLAAEAAVRKKRGTPLSWVAIFEVISQLALISFIMALLLGWLEQKYVHKEYDEMLHSFLELKALTYEAFEEVVDHFFEVKTHVYYTTGWYSRHRIAAYGIIYVQFVQLILYFNVHPRMAVLTKTIMTGIDHMVHFLLLFAILFCFLAFMAHWMFGPDLDIFQTFPQTISEQIRMLFGEFLVAGEGMRSLTGTIFGIYILYFITFMFIVSWTLLNFFLAIVVDAFVIVKEDISSADIHNNFFVDLLDACKTPFFFSKRKWPDHRALQSALWKVQRHKKDGSRMTSKENNIESHETGDDSHEPVLFWRDVRDMFTSSTILGQRDGAVNFVCYYGAKCNAIVRVKNASAAKEVREADAIDQVLGGVNDLANKAKAMADKVGITDLSDKVGVTDLAIKAKSGIISVANKVGLSSEDVDPLALEDPSGTALEMELQKREKQLDQDKETNAPDEIELTDKEQALFVAGMKSLSKLVIKMEPLPESGSENEWAVMLSSLSVAVCRDLQYCAVFKEDDELSV